MGRWIVRIPLALAALAIALTALSAARGERYEAETARLTQQMSESERRLQARILDARADRSEAIIALTTLQVQSAALADAQRHLRVDLEAGELALIEEGRVLREAALRVGPEDPVEGPAGERWFFPLPRGELTIAGISRGKRFEVPGWWYVSQGRPDPGPGARDEGPIYGAAALALSDGSLIYAAPEEGPFAEGAVRRGGIEIPPEDLEAMLPVLSEGMSVYVF